MCKCLMPLLSKSTLDNTQQYLALEGAVCCPPQQKEGSPPSRLSEVMEGNKMKDLRGSTTNPILMISHIKTSAYLMVYYHHKTHYTCTHSSISEGWSTYSPTAQRDWANLKFLFLVLAWYNLLPGRDQHVLRSAGLCSSASCLWLVWECQFLAGAVRNYISFR